MDEFFKRIRKGEFTMNVKTFVNQNFFMLGVDIEVFMHEHRGFFYLPASISYNTDTEEYVALLTYYYSNVN